MSLTGIICTAQVPLAVSPLSLPSISTLYQISQQFSCHTLNKILTCVNRTTHTHTLTILTADSLTTLETLATHICEPFISPFLGMSIESAAYFLRKFSDETVINSEDFYIADGRTIQDSTLLFIERHDDGNGRGLLKSVRVDVMAVSLSMVGDMSLLRCRVDGVWGRQRGW
ncbi:hypothetical protein BO71DRAFT_403439 [Aspergillus ellipticus CBS 707.79]|uniref:Uncharacterized protein n=1 Tax=Aspergillus ellipticus CBS 707.79 TaxID=1448320 RepID=A0A319CUP4_9EURO|nr:hypothetical protein BO71DRAFT_403439 [Aspergillus ellipticus CBS 707.79]